VVQISAQIDKCCLKMELVNSVHNIKGHRIKVKNVDLIYVQKDKGFKIMEHVNLVAKTSFNLKQTVRNVWMYVNKMRCLELMTVVVNAHYISDLIKLGAFKIDVMVDNSKKKTDLA
jgi:hypothetical protein